MTLEYIARTMLNKMKLPKYFQDDVVSIDCMQEEIYKGRNSNIFYLHVFRCKYFVLNKRNDNLDGFDAKED